MDQNSHNCNENLKFTSNKNFIHISSPLILISVCKSLWVAQAAAVPRKRKKAGVSDREQVLGKGQEKEKQQTKGSYKNLSRDHVGIKSSDTYHVCILVTGLMRPVINQKDWNCHFRNVKALKDNI